jgi:hypothetical protein
VLTPRRLTAEEALDLYSYRWSIERMFFDLQEVLNLNRLYAANPNAVAMQVYAAAPVYNAFRVTQSEAAAQVGSVPEEISPAKLFPKTATASFLYLYEQALERRWRRRHPRLHIRASSVRGAGPGLIPVRPLCTSSAAPSSAAIAASVQPVAAGTPSPISAAAVGSSRSYLSGDVTKDTDRGPDRSDANVPNHKSHCDRRSRRRERRRHYVSREGRAAPGESALHRRQRS